MNMNNFLNSPAIKSTLSDIILHLGELELHGHFAGLFVDRDSLRMDKQFFARRHFKDATEELHALI